MECCHFSSDGKSLATGGHDRKVSLGFIWALCMADLNYCLPFHFIFSVANMNGGSFATVSIISIDPLDYRNTK